MYYDETTGLTFRTERDYLKVIFWGNLKDGFLRPIEGYSRYTILEDGTVMNIDRFTPVRPATNGDRLLISLVSDSGRRRTVGLARLIALHFIPKPADFDKQYYDVVHKDEDLFNVHPSNLMWVARWKIRTDPDNYSVDF